jgi:hypothetical protein
MNLDKAPYKYVIHDNIPKKYHDAIKKGIMSWNNHFKQLGLLDKNMVEVVISKANNVSKANGKANNQANIQENYKANVDEELEGKDIDIFDNTYNYVIDNSSTGLDGPYSGHSNTMNDFRSGEFLCGIITLNIKRLESVPLRYLEYFYDGKAEINKHEMMSKYISWVVAHEIGHQLGLRHNFCGNRIGDGYGSIMDYVDSFHDLEQYVKESINDPKPYDLNAIKYGYIRLEDGMQIKNQTKKQLANQTKNQLTTQTQNQTQKKQQIQPQPKVKAKTYHKPQILYDIAKQHIPFKTDDNYYNNIDPYVSKAQNNNNTVIYIKERLDGSITKRNKILDLLDDGKITHYEYSNLFLYIYMNKYVELAVIITKFIGARTNEFYNYLQMDEEEFPKLTHMLLDLIGKLKYSEKEYESVVYDFNADVNNIRTGLNKVKITDNNFYAYNKTNLYEVYQGMIKFIIKKTFNIEKLTRLNQNKQYDLTKLMSDIMFSNDSDIDNVLAKRQKQQKKQQKISAKNAKKRNTLAKELVGALPFFGEEDNDKKDTKKDTNKQQMYKTNININGIFPEVYSALNKDVSGFRKYVDKRDLFDNYLQYTWIVVLSDMYKELNDNYFIKIALFNVLSVLKKGLNEVLESKYVSENSKHVGHYFVLLEQIKLK